MLAVNFAPFPELSTKRLILRKLNDKDCDQFFSLRSNEKVMEHIGKKPMTSISEATDFIKMINDLLESNSGITWAMALKEEPEKLIGTIGLWRLIKEHFRAEIGYMLRPEYWRKGITKEAILKVLDFGFNELKLHSVEGKITPLNIASANILESTGFVREAYFKEDFFFDGKFEDTAIYSLLSRNFSRMAL
jgi:ribosomal-protein-alanine N-acetyltransferase